MTETDFPFVGGQPSRGWLADVDRHVVAVAVLENDDSCVAVAVVVDERDKMAVGRC